MLRRNVLFVLLGFFSALSAINVHAAETRQPLSPVMREMGQHFRIIAMALIRKEDTALSTLVSESALLAEAIGQAKQCAPQELVNAQGEVLTDDVSAKGLKEFDSMMVELEGQAKVLNAALNGGDKDNAVVVLKKMMEIQKAGHAEFR